MFDRVLIMPRFLILNIPWFWICLGYTRFWICLNNFWTCLNMPEYVEICVNVPKSAWMAFGFLSHCNPMSTWMRSYFFQCIYKSRSHSLKEHETVFLNRQNLIFPIVGESIWFVFCFRLNIFTRFLITLFNYVPG